MQSFGVNNPKSKIEFQNGTQTSLWFQRYLPIVFITSGSVFRSKKRLLNFAVLAKIESFQQKS